MKDFARWHHLKSFLESRDNGFYFYNRDIWLCHSGLNLGREKDGKGARFLRPMIIIKKFNQDIFWAVPLTSTGKKGVHYYPINVDGRISFVLTAQLRIMDRKRLFQKIKHLIFELLK